MNKQDSTTLIPFIALTVVFVAVSLMLWLHRGKSGYWLNKKMKFGALLLTITAVQAGCRPTTTCYDVAMSDAVEISGSYPELVVNLADSTTLKGTIYSIESTKFSFNIVRNDTVFQSDNILADDGAFDQSTEAFSFDILSDLQPGEYLLNIFPFDQSEQDDNYYNFSSPLKLINE